MDSPAATSLFSALNFIIIFVSSVSTDQTNITAQAGRDTFLPCRSPDNKPVVVVEWIRPDLGSEYVLLYRDDQLDPENQHVMFKDRVDLQDRQMKDGDVALVLRDVTTDDRGAYECRVIQTSSRTETVFIINLDVLPPPDQTNITVQTGQDTFLPCTSPDNKPVVVVEWIRPDLGSEYVLLYRNNQLDPENQHVMFKDRVDLQDRQMKDGNVSLVLRDVTTDDRGAYECQVVQRETNSRRMTIFIINLDVKTPPGKSDGGNRDGSDWVIGVSVGLLALGIIIIAVWLIHKKYQSQESNQSSEEPPQSQQPLTDQNRPDEQRVQSDLQDDGSRTSADQLSSRITD